MSTENYAKMMQSDERIKKIKQKVMANTDLGQFSFVFSDISFENEKMQIDDLGSKKVN